MDFNLEGIKQAPDFYVEVSSSFIAGNVRTVHQKHFAKLDALEKQLRGFGMEALHRRGNMSIDTKQFDRAQILDKIAASLRSDGWIVECWSIGSRNNDRSQIDTFVNLAKVNIVIPVGEFKRQLADLKALAVLLTTQQAKTLNNTIKNLSQFDL